MITAICARIGDEFDVDDVRYKKVSMATNADVDGAHIRTLLLTFFDRHMRPLLEGGYVYAIQLRSIASGTGQDLRRDDQRRARRAHR